MTRELQLQKELVDAIQNAYLESKFYEVKQNCDALKQLGELPNYILKIIDKADTAIAQADELIEEANSLLESGYPKKALDAYQKAGKIVKDHPDVETGIQKCKTQALEAEEYLQAIRQAVEKEEFDNAIELREQLGSLNQDLLVDADHLLQEYQILKKEKRKKSILFGLIAGLILMGVVVVVATYFSSSEKVRDRLAYNKLIQLAEKTKDPRKQLQLYRRFYTEHPRSQFLPQIKRKFKELPGIIDKTDFESALNGEKKAGDDLERAKSSLEHYLKLHPRGRYRAQIEKALQKLDIRRDERYYQRALISCDKAGEKYEECQKVLQEYLKEYPKGRYKSKVEKRLALIPGLIFERSYREMQTLQKDGKWKECLVEVEKYMGIYGKDAEKRKKLEELKNICLQQIDQADYELATKHAGEAVTDLNKAEEAYRSYIGQHPDGKFVLAAREAIQAIEKKRLEFKKKMAQLEAEKKDDTTWNEIKTFAAQTKDVQKSIRIISKYLYKYPKGRHVKEAKAEIVSFEKKWFRTVAPITDRLNSRILTVKGGRKIEGVTEFDGTYYYVKGKTSSYVLSKSNVIAVEFSDESKKAVEYNHLLENINVSSVSSLKKLANWCEKNGFTDKAFLCYRLIAFINPRDQRARGIMEARGYHYRNGIWLK